MVRKRRIRVSEEEYALLEAVRSASDQFDSSLPVGYVVGQLARNELSDSLNGDSDDELGVDF